MSSFLENHAVQSSPVHTAAADLERSLLSTIRANADSRQLSSVVRAFTEAAQREGQPVERIIVRLKEVVARARAIEERGVSYEARLAAVDGMSALIVRCCIEHYYRRSDGQTSRND